ELRRRGVHVIAGSVRRAKSELLVDGESADIIVQNAQIWFLLGALWLCICRWKSISHLIARVVFSGAESPWQRMKALLHTLMGAVYAVQLRAHDVEHVHVHHGYCGAWIGMIAARLLGTGFSLTLHGSDLLLHGTYLETKLETCDF